MQQLQALRHMLRAPALTVARRVRDGSVVNAFRLYEDDALNEIGRWEYNYAQLSPRHKYAPRCAASRRSH